MGLAAGPAPGMAGVLMGFVEHVKTSRREGRRQLGGDSILHIHGIDWPLLPELLRRYPEPCGSINTTFPPIAMAR
jgi:hypothetical protein